MVFPKYRADCAHKESDFSMTSSLEFDWIRTSKYLADFIWYCHTMREPNKFCQRGSNSDVVYLRFVFLVDEGREDSNTAKSWPSSARQGNANLIFI